MSKKLIKLDLTPFLAIALATNPLTIKGVDELYEKYKFKAYEAAKKSKYYKHPLITDGSIKREVTLKRALGLICLNGLREFEDLDIAIVNLFIKGWKSLHDYTINSEFIDILYVKDRIILDKDNDDYYVGINAVLLLFSVMYDKDIEPVDFRNDMAMFFHNYLTHLESGKKRFNYNFVRSDNSLFRKAKNIANRFYENFNVLNNTSDLVELEIIDDELADFCKSVSVIFDSENMMLSSMFDNQKILRRDVIELSALYYIHNRNQNKIESAKFIIYGLHLKYSIKAYKNLKDYYFKNNKETLYLELEKYQKEALNFKDENIELKKQIKAISSENNRLKNDYKSNIERENILLNREIAALKKTINELEKEKHELKEFADSFLGIEEDDLDEYEEISIPEIKAVIAGGHSSWHNKLKDILPNSFIYIEGDNEQFDEKVLDNRDYVFIYTKYMGHGFYYKLIEKCKKSNIKTSYISHTSPGYVIKEIADIINTEKPTN